MPDPIATIVELNSPAAVKRELAAIGADKTSIGIMGPKGIFFAVKLKEIAATPANIIKQEMLSKGGEAAVAWGTINGSRSKTDILLMGTEAQLKRLMAKLRLQPFGLKEVVSAIEKAILNYQKPKSKRTQVMGILNITPDSFSDGGEFFQREVAMDRAQQMIDEGVDIIDIGGESTRPGAAPVPADTEVRRVVPVIEAIRGNKRIKISIDTSKAKVARAAVKAGADIINDVTGLRGDRKMAEVAAELKVPVVVMHMRGIPRTMQKNPVYGDLVGEILEYLAGSIAIARKAGIAEDKIIIDPGLGFGKTVEHNLEIIRRLKEFKSLGQLILIGPSRKSFIGKILDLPVEQRLEGTLAVLALAIYNGADIIRVHDVQSAVRIARMADAIIRGR